MRVFFESLLMFLLAFQGVRAGYEDDPENLSNWVKKKPANVKAQYWSDANHDTNHEWTVFLNGDQPSARLGRPQQSKKKRLPFDIDGGTTAEGLAGERVCVKVSDGWMVGFSAGEWVGALWWFSPDGKKRTKISKDQVVGFVEVETRLFAVEGLAHLSISRGQIVRISKGNEDLWLAEPFIDLKGAPMTVCDGLDGTLIVATFDRLIRVHPATKTVDVLFKDAFWGILYPKSMICTPNGTIYLGMRHGVAEIVKSGTEYQVNWLTPPSMSNAPGKKRTPGTR